MGIQVRRLKELDLLAGFFETLYNLTPEKIDLHKGVLRFTEIDLSQNVKTFVAVDEGSGQVIGTATLVVDRKFIHNCASVGRVEDVSTRKGFEGQGIGKQLVLTVVEEAKKAGCYKVILACTPDKVPFYRKCGFYQEAELMRMNLTDA